MNKLNQFAMRQYELVLDKTKIQKFELFADEVFEFLLEYGICDCFYYDSK